MLLLPNNCKCSGTGPAVSPQNWKQLKSLPLSKNGHPKPWRIHYRFYDPKLPYPVEVSIKGMNEFTTIGERKKITQELLDQEIKLLNEGYHPFYKKIVNGDDVTVSSEIDPNTVFFEALSNAWKLLDCSPRTKQEIKSNLYYLQFAIQQLHYQFMSIKDVRRKHIRAVLTKLAMIKHTIKLNVKGRNSFSAPWTNNMFNQFRKNLSILFEQLIEHEATEVNAVHGLKKKKHAAQKREVLTPKQCEIVDEFARNYDTRYWILIHCFYNSGARNSEIFRVQGEHVNLQKQTIKYLVLKGKEYEWIERPIVNAALPFWQLAMQNCGPKDFVFSKGLQPGPHAIKPAQATRRWKRHIKDKLSIDCDWYSLKHLNTMKNVDIAFAMVREAQKLATEITGHHDETMIAKVYDINSAKRFNDELKQTSSGLV